MWALLQVRWMMEADGYRPQGSVWGSLITACGKAGQLGSAEALWLEMHAAGVAPTEHHYQALMNACVWTFQVLLRLPNAAPSCSTCANMLNTAPVSQAEFWQTGSDCAVPLWW